MLKKIFSPFSSPYQNFFLFILFIFFIAGLRIGDVIVAMDDKLISTIDDLHRFLTNQTVGRQFLFIIIRDFEKMTIPIVPELNR